MNSRVTAQLFVPTWALCVTGAAGLAVSMGIGRFALTPLLPLMQREGLLSVDVGAFLATANYLGYLIGALTAARVPVAPRTLVLIALFGTAALTAAMGSFGCVPAWLLLRLMAGVASAWALVGVSSWAVPALAKRGRADAAGCVFAGVGLGIALAGGWVWWFSAQPTPLLWLQLGGLALVLSAVVAIVWQRNPLAVRQAQQQAQSAVMPRGSWPLVLCYGALGFGYILPATYLPALARELIDDPQRFGLVWPVFGLAAAASTLLAGRALRRWHRLRIWSVSYGLMAAGCALPLLTHSGVALTLAALLVGGTFMVATMVGLQQARTLVPTNPTPLLGRMAAAFASGQIASPLVALALARVFAPGWSGIEITLILATISLLASAFWLQRLSPVPEILDEHTPVVQTD